MTPLVCCCLQRPAPIGRSPLTTALPLNPLPPQAAVPIGLSPPCALPLLPLPFPPEVVPTEPPDCPCFTAPCGAPHGGGPLPSPLARGVRGGGASNGQVAVSAFGSGEGGGVDGGCPREAAPPPPTVVGCCDASCQPSERGLIPGPAPAPAAGPPIPAHPPPPDTMHYPHGVTLGGGGGPAPAVVPSRPPV